MFALRPALGGFSACCLAFLSACVSTPEIMVDGDPTPPLRVSTEGSSFPEGTTPVVLRPQDRISVSVLREPELSAAEVRIAEDGTIGLPYLGAVRAAGVAPAELETELEAKLSDYLVDPRVAVNVISYDSHVVTVAGSVSQPGMYQFQPNTTLLGAISLARGTNRVAELDRVAIFRNEGDARSVAVFDLREVQAGRMIDPVLVPGDRVVVGLSGLSQTWQDILQALPAAAIFTRF